MKSQPTTIALVGQLIAERLTDHYQIDPAPLLEKAGLDPALMNVPGARYPRSAIMKLWDLAVEATGDQLIGLNIGLAIRTTSYHGLGFAWLSSHTLLDALQRLARYYRVIVTVPLEVLVEEQADTVTLEVIYSDPQYPAPPIALDSFLASIIKLCRTAKDPQFSPLKVEINHEDYGRAAEYEMAFACPVQFGTGRNMFHFDREAMLEVLPGNNLDVVLSNDRVVEQYLEVLDPDQVTTVVRKLLVGLFPTGEASQQIVAHRMARSVSTLQRQLTDEGTSYREVQDEIRERLAAEYVREAKYSLSQIAYLLGFSDQSNFSRAFKRWKGVSPKEFQNEGQH
jgi:AraC-like DNA-binding protein